MKWRKMAEIFQSNYLDAPDEEELRQRCRAWIDAQLPPAAVARQIDKEECPFVREALATTFTDELDAFATDNGYFIHSYIREELEDRLRPIVRIAHSEQLHVENTLPNQDKQKPGSDTSTEEETHDQTRIERLEKGLLRMQEDLNELREERTHQPVQEQLFRYISPFVTDEAERLRIHKIICNLIASEYSMAELCRNLKNLEADGKIALNVAITAQYNELVRLGLVPTRKGYSLKNYENYMLGSKNK